MEQSPQQYQHAQDFNSFVRRLGQALGFEPRRQDELLRVFQNFTQGDRYQLIRDTDRYVRNLEVIDNELRELPRGILSPYMDGIRENWDNMNQQLAQLQILSLLQKKENCEAVIKELLSILNRKITSVNEILRNNLEQERSISASQPSALGSSNQQPTQTGVSVTLNPSDAFRSISQRVVARPEARGGVQQPVGENERRFNGTRQLGQQSLPPLQTLGGGANDHSYMNKYLKYKNKYLSLKKGIL